MQPRGTTLQASLCAGLFLAHAALYLALLYLATVLILPHYLDGERIRDLLIKGLESRAPATELHLGDAEVALLPLPHISLDNLSVQLPGNTLIQIRKLDGYPDLLSILSGSPKLGSFVIQSPTLISGNPRKTVNWVRPEEPRELSVLLSAMPEVECEIQNGEAQIFGKRILQLQKINVALNIAEELRLNLRAEANFSRELHLALESEGRRSSIRGSLQSEELRLELLTPYLPSSRAEQWLGSSRIGLDADFSFAGSKEYEADVRMKPSRLQLISNQGAGQIRIESGLTSISGDREAIRVRLKDLNLSTPQAVLDGTVDLRAGEGKMGLDLEASEIAVPSLASICKDLFPEEEFIESFSIVPEGRLPWATITTSGRDKKDLLAGLSIQGRLEEGRIDLPQPDIELDRASGTFYIVEDALSLTDFAGELGQSEITSGRAAMGLTDEVNPLCLYLESRIDLAQTARLLERNLDLDELRRQLGRIESLQGRADATFGMTKQGEDVEWRSKLSRIDLQAKHEAFPLPFSLSRGKLAYENGTLRFDRLRGAIGNSSIRDLEGSLRLGPSNALRLRGGNSDLDLEDLATALLDLSIFGSKRKALHTLEGKAHLEKYALSGPLQAPKKWDFNATGSLPRLKAAPPSLDQSLEISAESLSSKGRDLSWTGLTLSSSRSRITSQGELAFGPKGVHSIQGSIQGGLRSSQLLDRIYALASVPEPFRLKAPLSISQGRFQWQGKSHFSLRSDFRLAGKTTGHVDLSAKKTGYLLNRLRLRHGDKSATLQATLRDRSLDIAFDGELDLGKLRFALRHPGPLHGDLAGDFHTRLEISPFRFVASQGNLRVNELDLPPRIGSPLLRLDRAHLEGKEQTLSLRACRLQLNNRPIDINGSVEVTQENNILDLELRAGDLDLKWLKTVQDQVGDTGSDKSTDLSRIKGVIDLRMDAFHLGELNIAPIKGIVEIRPKTTTVLINDVGLCDLDPLGQVEFRGDTISAELSAQIRENDLRRTVSCLGWGKKRISGNFSLSLRTRTEGKNATELKENNQGKLRFEAREGRIYQVTILSKILALLNTTEIVFGNAPDLQEEGMGYNNIELKGRLKGQVLHLKELTMDGKTLKIAGSGTVDQSSMRLDLILLVSPLKTVDRIVSWIPVVNYILDDTLLTIPFRVTGKVDDPTVVPLSPQAVGSEVFGIMKRTLSLPFKVFQPLMPEDEEEKVFQPLTPEEDKEAEGENKGERGGE